MITVGAAEDVKPRRAQTVVAIDDNTEKFRCAGRKRHHWFIEPWADYATDGRTGSLEIVEPGHTFSGVASQFGANY